MTTVILLMAGLGKRLNAGKNKMLVTINNKPLYEYAIDLFKNYNLNILLVVSEEDYDYFKSLDLGYELVIGGQTRQESVLNALKMVKTDRVLIHDGARILTSKKIIDACLNSKSSAYFVATPVINTIRFNKENNFKTIDRNSLLSVQTPQGGDTKRFLDGAINALKNHKEVTDDISMLDNEDIEVILGEEKNIKVTTQNDLKLAKFYLDNEVEDD